MGIEDARDTERLLNAGPPPVDQPIPTPIQGPFRRTLQAFDRTLQACVGERCSVPRLLFFELIILDVAVLAILSPPVVMHTDGLRITGPVVEVSHEGSSNWMTVEDPITEFHYDAPASERQSIGDVVTVVVHPTDRTEVLLPTGAYVYAQGLLATTVLPLAWPLAWWVWRCRRHHPVCDRASPSCIGLSIASLVAIIVILLEPPMVPGVDRPEAFLGNLWLATVPMSLAVVALALNPTWRRPDGYWATAMIAIGLTLAGFALWIAEHV